MHVSTHKPTLHTSYVVLLLNAEFPSPGVARRLRQAGSAVLAAAAVAAARAAWLLLSWLWAQHQAGRLHQWWIAAVDRRVEFSPVGPEAALTLNSL